MHEVSIMQSTLELAEEHLRKAGGSRIEKMTVKVGLFSSVVPEALEFAFEALKEGTSAENATLEIVRVPGLFSCAGCGEKFELDAIQWECPKCGGTLTILSRGTELELAQMVID